MMTMKKKKKKKLYAASGSAAVTVVPDVMLTLAVVAEVVVAQCSSLVLTLELQPAAFVVYSRHPPYWPMLTKAP